MHETVAVAMLVLVLGFAVVRPRGLPEAVAAVPAALIVLAVGAITPHRAMQEVEHLFPVVAFLAAVLVISELCDADGLFSYAGATMAQRSKGSPKRLLTLVFMVAAGVTAVLSLDATVVLLTPVIFTTASRLGVRPRPHAYACTHLANAASLLLPVSNLTNLLAMTTAGITFLHFAGVMALPWLAVLAVEFIAFRWFFASDLSVAAKHNLSGETAPRLPKFSATILGLTLAGFVVASFLHIEAAWVALVGALIMLIRALILKQVEPKQIPGFLNIGFLAFILSLGVVVTAVVESGLGEAVGRIVPHGTGLVSLLAWATLATVLANLVNNLPAVLVLLPLAGPSGLGPVLAVLIGVNVGPNLTYVGSLATLLWRRIAADHDHQTPLPEFTKLGLVSTPAAVVAGVVALWGSLQIIGG